jgi:hypothetical protein
MYSINYSFKKNKLISILHGYTYASIFGARAVSRPGESEQLPGLWPKIFAISYTNSSEFLI